MTKHRKSRDARSEEILATLIKSTHTQKRPISLIEFARTLNDAIADVGSLEEVAERIDLSPRMLKQFILVDRLIPAVKELVATRQIDSVDAVGYLVQFKPAQQEFLAKQLAKGEIQTSDLRAARQFHKEHPNKPLSAIVERVLGSRTKKVYVLEFVFRGDVSERDVARKLQGELGVDGLASVEREGSFGRVVLTADGFARMRKLASERNTTLAKTLVAIINK